MRMLDVCLDYESEAAWSLIAINLSLGGGQVARYEACDCNEPGELVQRVAANRLDSQGRWIQARTLIAFRQATTLPSWQVDGVGSHGTSDQGARL